LTYILLIRKDSEDDDQHPYESIVCFEFDVTTHCKCAFLRLRSNTV
jgi:hypothetical protein